MKKDIKKQWVKALRSGKYKKAKGALNTGNGYCCLGVLTDLYIKDTKKGEWKHEPGMGKDLNFVRPNGQVEGGVLAREVQEWAGIPYSQPQLRHNVVIGKGNSKREYSSLIRLNDDSRQNFSFIADVIDEQL